MSTCLKYLRLHQRYVRALRHWGEATLSGNESEVVSTEAERRHTFGRLSQHRDNCRECQIASQGEVAAVLSESRALDVAPSVDR
jgi:hypothetical protein